MLYTVQNVYKHVDNVDNLLAEELFSNIYNVSGPHSYQQVTLCTIFKQKVLDFVESREIFARSTDLRDQFLQVCGGNSEVISLSGCINISKNDMICQGKSLGKFRKQSLGTCISMRLENTPDLFVWIIMCCMKCSLDLCRMVCVVINDGDFTVDFVKEYSITEMMLYS